ncbi:hypothetical protein STEG23_009573, partial [Scotinomys teguina]
MSNSFTLGSWMSLNTLTKPTVEQIGQEMLENLSHDREKIQRARERLREADANLGKSSRILTGMLRSINIIVNADVSVSLGDSLRPVSLSGSVSDFMYMGKVHSNLIYLLVHTDHIHFPSLHSTQQSLNYSVGCGSKRIVGMYFFTF